MKRNEAFSLIEVLLVLVVTGIILALAYPSFSKTYGRLELDKTADDLLACSRWAQAMAIGQGYAYALSFSGDRRSYSLARIQAAEEGDDQVSFKPVNGPLGRSHTLPRDVAMNVSEDYIEFYPDGTIDPATIELNSPGRQTVLSSEQVRGMMVNTTNGQKTGFYQ